MVIELKKVFMIKKVIIQSGERCGKRVLLIKRVIVQTGKRCGNG